MNTPLSDLSLRQILIFCGQMFLIAMSIRLAFRGNYEGAQHLVLMGILLEIIKSNFKKGI